VLTWTGSIVGFVALVVVLPRLAVYGCILFAVSQAPDFALTSRGFQAIGLIGFTNLEGGLLTGSLAVISLSSVVHALHLIRVLLCGIVCALSVCYLGKLRSTFNKDLETRYGSDPEKVLPRYKPASDSTGPLHMK
jgi:hypothetical protein